MPLLSPSFRLTWPRLVRCLWLAFGLLVLTPARAQGVQPVPVLSGRVVDPSGTLDPAQSAAIAAKLESVERIHGAQLVVLIVPSVEPEDIASYAQRVGDAWKIGRRSAGDGLLLVVARKDRKVRIEVAKGLEGAIPDVAADRIIRTLIAPAFKVGDYAGGLNRAIDALSARIEADTRSPSDGPGGSASAPRAPEKTAPDGPAEPPSLVDPGAAALVAVLGLAVLVGGALLTARMGRRLGSVGTAALAGVVGYLGTGSAVWAVGLGVAALVLVGLLGRGTRSPLRSSTGGLGDLGQALAWHAVSSRGGWGGGVSASSGGGFTSGGGGDFGGGGASGDW